MIAEPATVTDTRPAPRSAAERKRAQRRRDWAALTAGDAPMVSLTTSALADSLPSLFSGRHPQTLALVLCELGRRGGGVTVTAST